MVAGTQWRMGVEAIPAGMGFALANKPLGLDYPAVCKVAETYEVPVNENFFAKLNTFEMTILTILSGGNGRMCTAKNKKECALEYGEYFEWACKNCDKGKRD